MTGSPSPAKPLSILWIKSGTMFPANTGGRRRTLAMLREIAKRHRVTYLGLLREGDHVAPEEAEDAYAQEKIWVPWREADKGTPRFYAELLWNAIGSTMPYALWKYRSPALRDEIRALDRSGRFDLIVCDFLTPAADVAEAVSRTPVVLFQHNIESQIWRRLGANHRHVAGRAYLTGQTRRMERWERTLSSRFAGVITVSPEDTRHAREIYRLGNVLGDVPTGVDATEFSPAQRLGFRPEGHRLLFLGSMDWMPNIEAVHWFVREILPLVHRDFPDATLSIVGREPVPSVRSLGDKDARIRVSGTVPDVRPFLAECDVMVVPLQSGGGTRIKILEAMAAGIPIVSTAVGAEGLGLVSGDQIVIADEPETFARETARLLGSRGEADALAHRARVHIETRHAWSQVTDRFLELCGRILNQGFLSAE